MLISGGQWACTHCYKLSIWFNICNDLLEDKNNRPIFSLLEGDEGLKIKIKQTKPPNFY